MAFVNVLNRAADFQVPAYEFTSTMVTFSLDGNRTHEADGKFLHHPQSAWLTSLGARRGEPTEPQKIDDKALLANAGLDWVRVYQLH